LTNYGYACILVSVQVVCVQVVQVQGARFVKTESEKVVAHINKMRPNTRLQIIQLAAKLFIEDGYSHTTAKRIAGELDLSPGNITFYFPAKEHMLAVLVDELFDF